MEFSNYLLNPIKHKFAKTVCIYSIVTQAVKKFAALVKVDLKIAEERKVSFPMFPARLSNLKKGFAGKLYALVTGGLENSKLPSVFKERILLVLNPVLNRYSSLSYTIAEYRHDEVMKHKGSETCYRCSQDHVFVIQGMNLFRKLGKECVSCKKFRDQYLDISTAPLLNVSFIVAPTFYYCQLDFMGPLKLYMPGHNMLLRNRKIQDCEVWVMV